ncbi:transglutaminase domain-containing protein [Bacillus sp. WLY-B-L8]|uniref:transglutaminase domain-containing protein n=1 Tax=Bacillus multifaciens TaxID=3068506 RepID=UPI002741A6D0|nr:transglutaminase domain-containing protein [Bacillus sp. WLY-B-L8]MDP7978922.1 transglutaminase domain-containing protein [Bacillus sp. WLY-B-L8]
MKKSVKCITTIALCSSIISGTLHMPSVSYAATKQVTDNGSVSDAKLIAAFQQELQQHLNNHETNITIAYKTKNSNIKEVLNTLVQAYNQTLEKDQYLKYNVSGTKFSIRGVPGNYSFTVNISYRETKEQSQYVMKQAKSIVNSIIKVGMDQNEKVKAVHDYVVKNVSYDTSLRSYTAYDALAKHSAVCQGYALLTYQLLKEAGIQSQIVTGTGNGQCHAWNLVNIDGKWYHLDTTFDDPVPDKQGRVTYSYFNMSDEQMSKDHQWDRSKYPVANTSYYNELTNKIKAGNKKAPVYQQILKDTNLVYLAAEFGAENYNQLKQKLQQKFTTKQEKVELRYHQTVNNTMNDVKKVLNEVAWPKGAKRVSYQVAPYQAQNGYSLLTITFSY